MKVLIVTVLLVGVCMRNGLAKPSERSNSSAVLPEVNPEVSPMTPTINETTTSPPVEIHPITTTKAPETETPLPHAPETKPEESPVAPGLMPKGAAPQGQPKINLGSSSIIQDIAEALAAVKLAEHFG